MGNKISFSGSNHTDYYDSSCLDLSTNSDNMDVQATNNKTEIINVYVESSQLKFKNTFEDKDRSYGINGETFLDVNQPTVDKYSEFELYVHKMETSNFFRINDNPDVYCTLPEDEDDIENANIHLEISLQKKSHGVVINSILYLSDHSWNTLVPVVPNYVNCIVCDQYMTLLECAAHITQKQHEKNLDLYKPLQEFQLNIVRQIRNEYHCGICNELFDIDDGSNHFDSKTHEEMQLFAYNKASDVIYNGDVYLNNGNRNNDCYHFNRNKIINNETTDTVWDSDNKSNAYGEDDTNYPTISNSVDFNYDYYRTEYDVNKLPTPGVSYSATLRKSKIYNNPEYFLIDAGAIKYKIPFYSWHMILVNKDATFWCMVCKLREHVRYKTKHCMESSHIKILDGFENVNSFKNHIIRKVNETLYHCAHCNELQLAHDMENHLSDKHPIKDEKYRASSTATNIIKKNDFANLNHDKSDIINDNDADNVNHDKSNNTWKNETRGRYNDEHVNTKIAGSSENEGNYLKVLAYFTTIATINPFGSSINVTLMAFHVICVKENDYYCGLCVVTLSPNEMKQHLLELSHIQLLQQHHFLPQFGNHLMRYIHGAIHCAICNMPIHINYVETHIGSTFHVAQWNNALTTPQNTSIRRPNKLMPVEEEPVLTNINKSSNETTLTAVKTESKPRMITKNTETKIKTVETELMKQEAGLMKRETELVVKEEIEIDESFDSDDTLFDLESYVFVDFKGGFKLTATSYNTLVAIGDGSRHCFICNVDLEYQELKKHVDSREHEKNLVEYKFLEVYEKNLIRQSYKLYHCCICNVILRYSELSTHFEWQPHADTLKNMKSIMKKQRKAQIPKMITIKTQPHNLYLAVKEPVIKILYSAVIMDNKSVYKKLFLVSNKLLKIKFESWHGIAAIKNGFKCILCQIEICGDITLHIVEEEHTTNLEKKFLNQYSTSLIREINSDLVNCVVCNIEVSSREDVVTEHIYGKKHKKNYDIILKYSTEAESYADCCGDVITI